MAKPKPSTPPGTNSFGRTYQEQMDFERSQKAKNVKDTNPLADFIGSIIAPKKKPSMDAKKKALKKKMAKIPASPTH